MPILRSAILATIALTTAIQAQRAPKHRPAPPPGPIDKQLTGAQSTSDGWPLVDGDYAGQRYSPATQLNPLNVRRLCPVCHADPGTTPLGGLRARAPIRTLP